MTKSKKLYIGLILILSSVLMYSCTTLETMSKPMDLEIENPIEKVVTDTMGINHNSTRHNNEKQDE